MAVLSNPLRYAFDESAARRPPSSPAAGSDDKPPVAEDDEPGLEGTDYYSPIRATFATGMHAAIVETDPDTAEIRILRYCVVHDCGTLINPMIVEGQIHGGVAQGVGGALYERIGVRRERAAAQRLVHGLPDAVRDRDARRIEIGPPRDAVAAEPAGHQGRRRGRRHPGWP